MNLSEQILQVVLCTIAILSALIAYEFYKSKDGRLRLLIIELFITKVWVYGGADAYYMLTDLGHVHWNDSIVKVALNTPMFIVMLKLWKFIRNKE